MALPEFGRGVTAWALTAGELSLKVASVIEAI
jgi:hypothetical protein